MNQLSYRKWKLTFNAGQNCTLLNRGRFFEAISVDSSQKFLSELHIIKVIYDFIPVTFDLSVRAHAWGTVIVVGALPAISTLIFVFGEGLILRPA